MSKIREGLREELLFSDLNCTESDPVWQGQSRSMTLWRSIFRLYGSVAAGSMGLQMKTIQFTRTGPVTISLTDLS